MEKETLEQLEKPEFLSRSFDILYFGSESGLNLTSDKNLKRKDNLLVPFPSRNINKGNKTEADYQKEQNRLAQQKGEKRDVNPLKSPDFFVTVNILNLRRNQDNITFDTKPSTYVTYNDDLNVGLALQENENLRKELGTTISVALTLLTTEEDGSSKLIIQHRNIKNRTYKDIIGASAAGFVEQKINSLNEENSGALKPINNQTFIDAASKEMEEEIGIDPEKLTDVKIVGIAKEKTRVHYEALLLGNVGMSAGDIEKMSMQKKSVERKAFDFSEDFFVVDGTPEAIETLLTQVKCPISPSHMGAFVATGRILVLKRDGEEAAREWTAKMEKQINQNSQEIDEIVKTATNGREQGYNPRKTPQEQGLPDVKSELERTGLIKKEGITTVDEAYVFDVDGVITVPDSRLFDREVLENIAERLHRGEPVILNTGRSISWVQSRVIARLYHAHNVVKKEDLKNLFVVGEKGGTWLSFDDDGYMKEYKDDSISVPSEVQIAVKRIIEERFPKTMFFDKTKHTMISVEMKEYDDKRFDDEISLEQFQKEQQQLNEILKELLKLHGLDDVLEIDTSVIATDIQNKYVGKDFAIRKALAWLETKNVKPLKFVAIGDSKSDIAMASELYENGRNVEFVFVGNDNDKDEIKNTTYPFPVVIPENKYSKGTAEFLNKE